MNTYQKITAVGLVTVLAGCGATDIKRLSYPYDNLIQTIPTHVIDNCRPQTGQPGVIVKDALGNILIYRTSYDECKELVGIARKAQYEKKHIIVRGEKQGPFFWVDEM